MSICSQCGKTILLSHSNQNTQETPKTITVATDRQLSRQSHVQRLAMALVTLKQEKDLSRRQIPDWLAHVIFEYEGKIIWPVGQEFKVGDEDIDEAFGNEGSFRWLSDFISFATVPPRQRPQRRVLARLRLIDLAFRIAYPKRAELIAR